MTASSGLCPDESLKYPQIHSVRLLDRIPRLPDRCLISREYILIFTKSPCESHTPPLVLAAVRKTFGEVVGSDAFVADMDSRGYDVGLKTGEEYQVLVEGLTKLPPETLEVIRGLFPES